MDKLNRQEIFEKVKKILIEKLGEEKASNATEASNVIEDLGADSLDVTEIIMDLESEFKTSIPNDEAEKMKTVSDIVDAISKIYI